MIEKIVTTSGFKFVYTPSLKSMGVHYPNGRLEIIHGLYDEQKANKIVGDILERHRNRA